jgi:hypothetical protein
MNWNDVAKAAGPLLVQAAPTLGSLIGGVLPIPGGSLLGQEAGKLLANAFGVDPTPEAVNSAIQSTPPDIAALKYQAAESEAAAKWPALAQMAQAQYASDSSQAVSINETMRAELAKGQVWWTWRNLYGYSVTAEVAALFPLFMVSILFMPDVFLRFMSASSWLTGWYTLRFGLLGFIHSGASNEKIAAVTGEAPSITKAVVAAIKKK